MTLTESKLLSLIEDMIGMYDEDVIKLVLKTFYEDGAAAALYTIEELVQDITPRKETPVKFTPPQEFGVNS